MCDIVIQSVQLSDITSNPSKYNISNQWLYDNRECPTDYTDKIKQTNTKEWIDLFHDHYEVINIPIENWMFDAQRLAETTGRFSKIFDDYLDVYCKKIHLPHNFWKSKRFLKTESVSFKEGMYGIGPYESTEEMVKALTTCIFSHNPLHNKIAGEFLKIYVLPWKDINPELEFRAFVYNKRLVGISQQHLYSKWKFDIEYIPDIVNIISEYFYSTVRDVVKLESYTIDICLLDAGNNLSAVKLLYPYLIELNGFGADYSAGSSLFNWNTDTFLYEQHSGRRKCVHFRYVV